MPQIPAYLSFSLVFLLLLVVPSSSALHFRALAVKGTLMCGSAPAPGVRVRLWDNDMGDAVDIPIERMFTNSDGKFDVEVAELVDKDNYQPVVRITHDCNDGLKPGQRLFRFKIPRRYAVEGKKAKEYFDLGVINLEMVPYNEERSSNRHRRDQEEVLGDVIEPTRHNTTTNANSTTKHSSESSESKSSESTKNHTKSASKKSKSSESSESRQFDNPDDRIEPW